MGEVDLNCKCIDCQCARLADENDRLREALARMVLEFAPPNERGQWHQGRLAALRIARAAIATEPRGGE